MKKIPFYPVLFSAFSVLALFARNIHEVEAAVLLRPLLVSLGVGILVYAGLYILLRDWDRAAVLASFLFVWFYSYGYVYQFFETRPGIGSILGRHRYLILVYLALLGIGWWVGRFKLRPQPLQRQPLKAAPLQAIGWILVIIPLLQIGAYAVQALISSQARSSLSAEAAALSPRDPAHLPDVYFIVLDGYTRSDALERDYGYDNSYFIEGLQAQGFYVADCSRSNYGYTQASITASLNLDYLPELQSRLAQVTPPTQDVFVLLKQSLVRQQLEALGYQTVAFETGYEWSRLADADIYLSMAKDPLNMQQALNPFEAMYIKTTALLLATDTFYRTRVAEFRNPNYPYSDHVERQRFIIDQLPQVAGSSSQPKFVFVHFLIPHEPFVFEADGEVATDPGYYSGEQGGAINDIYRAQGYTNQVEFISKSILAITAQILANSPEPPIIVLQGDHGFLPPERYMILNAYYLPDQDYQDFYPGITPVNSFRLVFNRYFGSTYELLPDLSLDFKDGQQQVVEETYPPCQVP